MAKYLTGLVILFIGLISPAAAAALTLGGEQDCDANAVVRCGISSSSMMAQAYQGAGVADVYNCFGISRQDINNFDSEVVRGTVTSSGKVVSYVTDTGQPTSSGRTVATGAITAGRQNIPGSTAIDCNGTTFYKRPTSVSFQSSILPAYIVLRSDQFVYAIIASCGNPVMATPVAQPAPKVKGETTTGPAGSAQSQTQTQSQTVNVNQPAPAVAPAATPAAPAKVLPNTGPGDVVGLSGISTVLGTVGHFIYSRRKTV